MCVCHDKWLMHPVFTLHTQLFVTVGLLKVKLGIVKNMFAYESVVLVQCCAKHIGYMLIKSVACKKERWRWPRVCVEEEVTI